MHDVNDDPILWLREFGRGFLLLSFTLFLAGFWTLLIIRLSIPRRSKFPVCATGLATLSVLSSYIFDPSTHLVGSLIGAISMTFTTPLHAITWLHLKTCDPPDPTPPFIVLLRIAVPAALPSSHRPPERVRTQLLRGIIYLIIAFFLSLRFDRLLAQGGFALDFFSCLFITASLAGVLNLTSAVQGMLGAPSPSPVHRPLVAPSLARFWGGRWNRPVSDALRVAIYNPMYKVHGYSKPAATMACFVASAIAHELALLYCGMHGSRGEWFAFFILSGLATITEPRVHLVIKGTLPRYLYGLCVFYTLFHFLFLPVTLRIGLAAEWVRVMRTGSVLIQHMMEQYLQMR